MPTEICSKPSNCQTPSLIWVVDQDQLNPYVANEGYVVRVPHNPPKFGLFPGSNFARPTPLIHWRWRSMRFFAHL